MKTIAQTIRKKVNLNYLEEHPVELFDNSIYGSKKEISIYMVKRRRKQQIKNSFYYIPIIGMLFLYKNYSTLNYRWFGRNYNKILWTNIIFLSITAIFLIFINFLN
jgi:hypothetical protein